MPTLTQEFAEVTSASHVQLAEKLGEQVREFQRQAASIQPANGAASGTASLCRVIQEAAQQATDRVSQELQLAKSDWQSALNAVGQEPFGEEAANLLRTMLRVFEAGERLAQSSRSLWQIAESLGLAVGERQSLDHAAQRYRDLAAEASNALAHRSAERQPVDSVRLQEGLKAARAGRTVSADQAKQWFRKS